MVHCFAVCCSWQLGMIGLVQDKGSRCRAQEPQGCGRPTENTMWAALSYPGAGSDESFACVLPLLHPAPHGERKE